MDKFKIAEFITTFCYIGKSKYCPGTLGALASYLLIIMIFFIISPIAIRLGEEDPIGVPFFYFIGLIIALIITCMLLFIAGRHFSDIYIQHTGREDPQEIVIDEVLGQLITTILCAPSFVFFVETGLHPLLLMIISFFILPFILFRLFDIFKPWPINWIDKNIKGGLGVMLDDIIAAIFAIVINYALVLTFSTYPVISLSFLV